MGENMNEKMSARRAIMLIKGFLDDFPAIVVVLDYNGSVVYHNYEAERVLGDDITCLDMGQIMTGGRLSAEYGPNKQFEAEYKNRWYKTSVADTIWMDEEPAVVLVGLDITQIKISEKRFKVSATTDAMTGILNRQAGYDILEQSLLDVSHRNFAFCVCYFDINDLKLVNDLYGHFEGDAYIASVVDVVKKAIRQSDVFARMGGDEFLVIFYKCPIDAVSNIMSTVNARLSVVATLSDRTMFKYSISYGIVEVNSETKLDAEAIMQEADAKMYEMKKEYRLGKDRRK